MTEAPVAKTRRALAANRLRGVRATAAREERGAATAEYAVATAGAVGFAGLLIKFLTGDTGQELIKFIFDLLMKMIGSFF